MNEKRMVEMLKNIYEEDGKIPDRELYLKMQDVFPAIGKYCNTIVVANFMGAMCDVKDRMEKNK